MNYRFYFKAWLQTFLALKALKTLEDLQEMVLLIRKLFSKNLNLFLKYFLGSLPSLEPLPIEGLLAIEGNSTNRMRKMPKLRKMPIQASTEILAITENRNYHPTKDMPTLTRRPDSGRFNHFYYNFFEKS